MKSDVLTRTGNHSPVSPQSVALDRTGERLKQDCNKTRVSSVGSLNMAMAEGIENLHEDKEDKCLTPSRELDKAIKEGIVKELSGNNDTYYRCVICDKTLKSKSTIKSHLKTVIHVQKYREARADQPDRGDGCKTETESGLNSPKVKGPTFVSKLEQDRNLQTEFDMITKAFLLLLVLPWRIVMCMIGYGTLDAVLGTIKDIFRGESPEDGLNIALQLGEILKSERDGYHYYCFPCKQHLKTKGTVKKHLTSATHKSKVGKTGREEDGIYFGANDPTLERGHEVENAFWNHVLLARDACADSPSYWCTLCLKPLTVYGNLAGHLSSITHKKKVETCRSATQTAQERLVGQTEIAYSSDFDSKGRVYVFNVLKKRSGAKADSLNILKTFGGLGYDVFLREDFKRSEILEYISEIQQDRTLESTGALILFILSHGCSADTFICADDLQMSLNEIKQNFTNKECPYLKGKPKIIFANFCRGQDIDENCLYFDDEPVVVEALVDTVIVHASNEGMITLRDMETGTLFVKSLCEVLSDKRRSKMFRRVFINLSDAMRQKGGTTPMAIDHVFKDFRF